MFYWSAICGTAILRRGRRNAQPSSKFSTCQIRYSRIISLAMQPLRNRSSPNSCIGSPLIALDVRPSRRVRIAVASFVMSAYAALVLSPEPGWPWRGAAGVLAIALGWRPLRTVVFGRGPGAVRRIEWEATGRWRISDGLGRPHDAELSPASAMLGPWLLLSWDTSGAERFHALIDAATTDAQAFRALKARLSC